MKQLFALEWYFPTFVVEVYKRMHLKSDEPWLTPDEMYQEIQKNDVVLSNLIKDFFDLYKKWYNNLDCSEAKDNAFKKRKEIADYINEKYGKKIMECAILARELSSFFLILKNFQLSHTIGAIYDME